ncbi:hypothetical protein APASM_2068 [Actinosynnema pretiosum subsp. pretiosum]|nr:hypothetical protein APASM_2068 [Actinosynnema pretiosum subsp. pretiosum]
MTGARAGGDPPAPPARRVVAAGPRDRQHRVEPGEPAARQRVVKGAARAPGAAGQVAVGQAARQAQFVKVAGKVRPAVGGRTFRGGALRSRRGIVLRALLDSHLRHSPVLPQLIRARPRGCGESRAVDRDRVSRCARGKAASGALALLRAALVVFEHGGGGFPGRVQSRSPTARDGSTDPP